MSKLSFSFHWIIQPLLVIGILVFGFIGASGLSMFKQEPQTAERASYAPLVRILETSTSTQQVIVEGNGTLQARTRINLVPQVGGRITYIHPNLRAGGFFSKNEKLIEIERIDYELEVTRIAAEVAAAKTALELEIAEADAAREEWLTLNPEQSVPTLVGREPQINEANAQLKAAQARLAQAQLDLKRTRIQMPFNGRVVSTQLDVGEVISANQQVGVVYNSDRFEIPVPLEVDELAWIDLPNTNNNMQGSPVDIHMTIGNEQYKLPGQVIRIESELEEFSRFARVVVSLSALDIPSQLIEKVIPGLFVNVSILSQQMMDVTVIPREALRQGDIIWTLDNDKRIQFIQANILYQSNNNILIDQLADGTQLVISNLDIVTEGMQVRVSEE